MRFDPWAELQRAEARNRQGAENAARLAQVTGFVDTEGVGEFEPEDEITFGVRYVEEPAVSYGHALDGDQLVPLRFPRSFGGVSRWRRDTRGFYVGAWVYVVVDARGPEADPAIPVELPSYAINHYFGFSGVAMKIVPDDLLAQK